MWRAGLRSFGLKKRSFGLKLRTVKKMKDQGLYPWQQQLIDQTSAYDDRSIHLVIGRAGDIVKSALTYTSADPLSD